MTTSQVRLGLLLLLSSSAACVPWYRTDEVRAIAADDSAAMDKKLGQCNAEQGDSAISCYKGALERNPREMRAALALAKAFNAKGRYAEARVVVEQSVDLLAKHPGGSAGDADAAKQLIALFIDSYAREELYGLALERSSALLASSTGNAGKPADVSLESAKAQFPAVFGRLADADTLAKAGKLREALDRYGEWLSDYGIPDRPMIQAWADGVLTACAPLTREFERHGDEAAKKENWVAALASYSLAARYLPKDEFDKSVADKLIDASSHVAETALLSPVAREQAEAGDGFLHDKKIGAALHAYRRAVASAPYWAAARHNVAVILASAEMYDSAADQMSWFLDLDAASPLAEKARALREEWASRAKVEHR